MKKLGIKAKEQELRENTRELCLAVKQLLYLADGGAFIDLANIEATGISRRLRAAVNSVARDLQPKVAS